MAASRPTFDLRLLNDGAAEVIRDAVIRASETIPELPWTDLLVYGAPLNKVLSAMGHGQAAYLGPQVDRYKPASSVADLDDGPIVQPNATRRPSLIVNTAHFGRDVSGLIAEGWATDGALMPWFVDTPEAAVRWTINHELGHLANEYLPDQTSLALANLPYGRYKKTIVAEGLAMRPLHNAFDMSLEELEQNMPGPPTPHEVLPVNHVWHAIGPYAAQAMLRPVPLFLAESVADSVGRHLQHGDATLLGREVGEVLRITRETLDLGEYVEAKRLYDLNDRADPIDPEGRPVWEQVHVPPDLETGRAPLPEAEREAIKVYVDGLQAHGRKSAFGRLLARRPRSLDEVRTEVVGEGSPPFAEVIRTADEATLDALKPLLDDAVVRQRALVIPPDERQTVLDVSRMVRTEAGRALDDQLAAERRRSAATRARYSDALDRRAELRRARTVDAYLEPDSASLRQAFADENLAVTEDSEALLGAVVAGGARLAAELQRTRAATSDPQLAAGRDVTLGSAQEPDDVARVDDLPDHGPDHGGSRPSSWGSLTTHDLSDLTTLGPAEVVRDPTADLGLGDL